MYNKNDLTEELDDIIRIYKTIPDIRNKKSATIRITFEYDNKVIYLVADTNAQELMEDQIDSKIVTDYKRIQKLCETHDVNLRINHLINLSLKLKTNTLIHLLKDINSPKKKEMIFMKQIKTVKSAKSN